QACSEIKRLGVYGTAIRTSRWPRRKALPFIGPSLKCTDRRHIGFRRSILQILVQKWPKNVLPEIQCRVVVEPQSTERAAVVDLLAVMPRPHDQKNLSLFVSLGLSAL